MTSVPSSAAYPLVVAALLLAAVPAFAQQPDPDTRFDVDLALESLWRPGGLTADQAAQRGRAVSPAVRAAGADSAAAAARLDSATILRVPRLTVAASYTRLSDIDPPTAGGDIVIPSPILLDNYGLGAVLEVPLSDHVTRFPHLVAGARHGAASAAETELAAGRAAALGAREAYYEWVRARLSVLVAERLVAQVEANLAQVRARAEAETASRVDVLRLEAQRAEATQRLLALGTLAGQREHALRIAIGARDGEAIAIGEDVRALRSDATPVALSRPIAAAIAEALRRRPEVRALDLAVAASERAPRAAAADLWPRLDGFAQLDYTNPNARVFPARDDFELTWAAGLRASYSIDGALAAGPAIAEARAESARLRAERASLADAVELEVRTASDALELARRSLVTTEQGLAAAEENYRVRRELFAAERATSVELVDAETELLRARTAAVDARIDLRLAAARLRHASGLDD